ncbi:MAG: hypothetical protein Q9169_005483 [Polycauliona sp. 2 TL-2023]
MAILGAFQAEVLAHGEVLPEHQYHDNRPQDLPPRTVIKYVEVPIGEEFQVLVRALSEDHAMASEDLEVQLDIDNDLSFIYLWNKPRLANPIHFLGEEGPGEHGTTVLRPLLLESIDFVHKAQDASSGTLSLEGWKDLGTIKVSIYKITKVRRIKYQPHSQEARGIRTEDTSLKPLGITQSVILGPSRFHSSEAPAPDYGSERLSGEDSVMVTFIFKYRTKEVLDLILNPTQNIRDENYDEMSTPELQAAMSSPALQSNPRSEPSRRSVTRAARRSTSLLAIERREPPEPVSRDTSATPQPPEPISIDPSASPYPPEPLSRESSTTRAPPEPIIKEEPSSTDPPESVSGASSTLRAVPRRTSIHVNTLFGKRQPYRTGALSKGPSPQTPPEPVKRKRGSTSKGKGKGKELEDDDEEEEDEGEEGEEEEEGEERSDDEEDEGEGGKMNPPRKMRKKGSGEEVES